MTNLEAIGKVPPAQAAQKRPVADVEDHLVAHTNKPASATPAQPTTGRSKPVAAKASAMPTSAQLTPELAQWKAYLTREVQQGRMTRDEARAAWLQRVQG